MALHGLVTKFKQGLAKTRHVFGGIRNLFRIGRRVDRHFLDDLEAQCYQADIGVEVTAHLVERVQAAYENRDVDQDLIEFVKAELKGLLKEPDNSIHWSPTPPTVIMVAGVNGSGKTTSIAKLASRFRGEGRKVMVAACDTFRAAAIDQLTVWTGRVGCELIKGNPGTDPASVAHDALSAAKARNADVVIVDTAGRLHTQVNLMKELEKIHRVISRQIDGAPHEVLLVLDATNGQNAIQQAQMFTRAIHCTGIVLAKLDGTAKGGAIVPIRRKIALPVKFVGVGEGMDDLEPFDPDSFVEALFE